VTARLRAVSILWLAGCPAPARTSISDAGTPGSTRIEILATGDVGSDTDVCGCKSKQLGGLARRAKLVKDRGAGALVVDAGDLFFRTWSIAPRYEAQARVTAELHADALRRMRAAAVAVGERDLALGVPYLRSMSARSGVPFLSANLVFTKSGTAAFDAFTIVERNGVRIGVIGASPEIGPKAQAFLAYERAGVTAQPVAAALEKAAKEARAKADVVVALLHVGQDPAAEALGKLPPGLVDLAIVGHERTTSRLAVAPEGRAAWVHAGARGKWLLSASIDVAKGAKGVIDATAVAAERKTIASIDERIAAYRTADAGASDPATAAKVGAERIATIERLEKRKRTIEAELAVLRTDGKHLVAAELIELLPELPEDPEMAERYAAYRARLFEVNSGEPPPDRAELEYTGNDGCKACHPKELAQWKTTKHAKAWDTMIRTRQVGNLDCVPCHVTGFDRRGGPQGIRGLERFVDVGCESCHGPGSAHARNPKVPLDYGLDVPERVCAECHRAAEDQKPFDYEERLPRVIGPGHRR
jgi:hypothetical protein